MTSPEPFEIYAIRYAHMAERSQAENFIGGDAHDGPMPMDYFVWAAIGPTRRFVIDTGFDAATAATRGRTFLRCPAQSLALVGLDANTVEDVVVTHMHYDHIGNFDKFPKARFHLQDREMAFATGRHMTHRPLRMAFDVETVTGLVREVYKDRVQFHDGTAELAPGFSLHWVGGHTAGLQVCRVWTERGWVVLASDASHYYANMEEVRPFPIVFHMGEMLEAYRTLRQLADSPDHIVPGHDPLVLKRYPAPKPDQKGVVARLDVQPTRG
jgi:glyoxylase-like metal-dependent hydrolase (beta-lactamase superfamily II)